MMRIGIYGYGNIGRGVEKAIGQNPDMKLAAVFTRRDPKDVKIVSDAPVCSVADLDAWTEKIDVMVICGGSATDLPEMTPMLAKKFHVVDSFDTHAKIPEHFQKVDEASKATGHIALISGGWDPGLFSINRVYAEAVLPEGKTYTFWGRGVSQGHSDAIRRIPGVKDARQYTVPIPEAVERVRSGEMPDLSVREKHRRECYVVPQEGADLAEIERRICTMPYYFDEYDTTVTFITEEELKKNHAELPHGGRVIRTGNTGKNKHVIEYQLTLDSNPEFTSNVLLALSRAIYRMAQRGMTGCKTILDIAPADLSIKSGEELRKTLL